MSFTDATYYVLENAIPSSTYSNLTTSIARYEKEVLQKLLGYELWKLVDAYEAGVSDQRIIDLVEGKEYTPDDVLVKWNGLINDDKISLLSDYVYFRWSVERVSTLQTTGMMKLQSENAERANVTTKAVAAYNRMVDLYHSCYDFLIENEDDYPEWVYTDVKRINTFGI